LTGDLVSVGGGFGKEKVPKGDEKGVRNLHPGVSCRALARLSAGPSVAKDAGNPPVRFDEREVETEHGMRLLRHSRGNPETEYVEAYPTAPPLDSTILLECE
jgi:hypothetical protein